ncbi:unnamed protein product [Didymodactylos carnosus]|uniref:Exonuclease domain-containing protein n=1 Tax=Didymodactylos carnosus TaxID=1234261 RepID=A0A813YBI4_9BILA|nr:unnamed protein product [Didymodactylos carnosus]CAF3667937.1 unnamed protein product [Didymodactylos carnosus]
MHVLDSLIKEFGLDKIQSWRNEARRLKSPFIFELVYTGHPKLIRHAVRDHKFNLNIKRDCDGNTPLHMCALQQNQQMFELLIELGAEATIENDDEQTATSLNDTRRKALNIIWLDLEMTSLDNPDILECAVIITDKYLNELDRGNWIVHFEQEELDKLEEWHQKNFTSRDKGGNGLFDDVVISTMTAARMEDELLALLKRHCPPKACPLAGNSIHWDRDVIRTKMPRVYEHLHYRVIDVSTLNGLMERWAPEKSKRFDAQVLTKMKGPDGELHRAMYDIERSIEISKLYQPLFTQQEKNN